MPIGNLTSQLFANIYLDAFDHFIKEELRARHYLRYTDDAVILHQDPKLLEQMLVIIEQWLRINSLLSIHPHKQEIRKLKQGIDFLGYITLPHYRILRTKIKQKMKKRINEKNLPSYLGLIKHCSAHDMKKEILTRSVSTIDSSAPLC